MDSEDVLRVLDSGKHNIFQWLTFFKLGFVYLRGCWHVLAIIFMGAVPSHWCARPEDTNSTHYYPDGECSVTFEQGGTNVTEECSYGYEYGKEFDSTIATDFDLVCKNDYQVDLSTTIYMIGSALGAILITPLSDKYGRKKVLLVSLWIQGVFGIGVAFVQSYIAFVITRFVVALLNMAIALIAYVMITELFTTKKRTLPSVGVNFFWSWGIMTLALFGYLIRDWRHMQILITVPNFITVLYIWFLPESIHWLLTNKRWKLLRKTVKSAAKTNSITISEDFFRHMNEAETCPSRSIEQVEVDTFVKQGTEQHVETKDVKPMDGQTKAVTILDLFKTPKIRRYTIVMFYLWFVISLAYFGILFSTPTLHGNMFVNLAISGAVEMPACLTCMYVLERTGRRKPLVCFMLLCGVMNIVTIFVPAETASGVNLQPLTITFAMIGKFGITGAYSTVYLMSAEIFPTSVRNQAVGLSSFFENCGSISAPFIVYGAKNLERMPLVIFGALTVLGGLLALMLPETHGQALPENIPDIDDTPRHVTKTTAPLSDPGVTRL
ncbi:organic cation transporter protein-like [Mya arenaria]|uniref:organic cation transporter protein-like n=1 Tax=Mya arenaria TaxID=6604 RepID=UPI0022E68131|nr:organic cation transporter protein-like [Mya arenaria]XP_052766825.1 organic cation transporter protein-like [Mya arenaria]XP_052766826.1 organic cation transporter protein-like [Mya arenaria]XP_052766828.1 organic cation transporter protein-like [Mya arenaria]XP_052766829.1 organic cation transporter protein-like [Mya arenaria]XP_052766830.1 organic cation transporter protein-like [Mya arenaria]XP_052766831.1 organic cation transporter protein-like [Mya arenaria]XP_052766832.1 organic ca